MTLIKCDVCGNEMKFNDLSSNGKNIENITIEDIIIEYMRKNCQNDIEDICTNCLMAVNDAIDKSISQLAIKLK